MATELNPEAVKLVNRVLEKLKERKVVHDYCPRCETFDWNVDPVAISVVPLQGVPAAMPYSYFPAHITVVQIVCKNCGYTMFHNLDVLGLTPPHSI
jgi:hypothetical protein